jgi:putative ABC transport system substrate-binding protein
MKGPGFKSPPAAMALNFAAMHYNPVNLRRQGHHPVRRFAATIALTVGIALVSALPADAEGPTQRVVRLGYLGMGSPPSDGRGDPGILKRLSELGWVEGRNLIYEPLWAEGNTERVPNLIAHLLEHKADIIVTGGTPAAIEAKKATTTVPIILVAYDRDPVASGVIDSLSRPGGNVTGIFSRQIELVGKRLELLKETLPNASRVAVFYHPSRPPARDELYSAAKHLGLKLQWIEVKEPQQLDGAFRAAKKTAGAVLVLYAPMFHAQRERIAAAAIQTRLPTMCQEREFVAAGALMSYAPDRDEILIRVAYYVDRLLRGATPSDLPVEEANKFKFAINLKTAQALGIEIPQSIVLRADEVIR